MAAEVPTGVRVENDSLASLSRNCLDYFDRVLVLGQSNWDLQQVSIRIEIERLRLNHYEQQLELLPQHRQGRLLESQMLERIGYVCRDIEDTVMRNLIGSHQPSGYVAGSTSKQAHHHRISWIAGDEALLENRVSELSDKSSELLSLAIPEASRIGGMNYHFLYSTIAMKEDPSQLEVIEIACRKTYPEIAQAATMKGARMRHDVVDSGGEPRTLQSRQRIHIDRIRWDHPDGIIHAISQGWAFAQLEASEWESSISGESSSLSAPVLVEWRVPVVDAMSQSAISTRLNSLCAMLKTMNGTSVDTEWSGLSTSQSSLSFRALECIGWTTTSSNFDYAGLVFRYPSHRSDTPPTSLKSFMLDTHHREPEVGIRFQLAFNLVSAVANMVAVGIVHRGVRSSNVMLFDVDDISQAYLVGLTYVREGDAAADFASVPMSEDMKFYQPPRYEDSGHYGSNVMLHRQEEKSARKGNTATRPTFFRDLTPMAIDMFGLGVILVEIGLWQAAGELAESTKSSGYVDFLTRGMDDCLELLSETCGNSYVDVIKLCLNADRWGDNSPEEDLSRILTSLQMCRAEETDG